ncbi:hypothetical protein DVG78_02040 [Runella aurantiaca]|uniref:Uncharacterized protein n=1 Tax=Runella aurantiaca TaxID=2282308 RepID=A0A369IMJ1_9BACT|nr:hypothetical protein DVG78_02040 [Runella aurantiaca]
MTLILQLFYTILVTKKYANRQLFYTNWVREVAKREQTVILYNTARYFPRKFEKIRPKRTISSG